MVLRDFVARAEAYGIDYNIIEAFDQPWKTIEGGVGTYWGMFDASRNAKFAWTGPVSDPDLLEGAPGSRSCSACCCRCRCWRGRARPPARRSCSQSPPMRSAPGSPPCSPSGKAIISCPAPPSRLALGVVLLVPLVVIALARIEEIAAIAFGRSPRRLIAAPLLAPRRLRAEGVDPHPGLPRAAGDAQGHARCGGAARLSEFRMRGRHQQHARPGVLAADRGALPRARRALQVRPRGQRRPASRPARCGSRSRTPPPTPRSSASSTPTTWCIQTGSRTWCRSSPIPRSAWSRRRRTIATATAPLMHHAMNGEYAGFFDIGMVQRNEENAIIVHGTMCLIRRDALIAAGGWSSDTICRGHRSRPDHARARLADRTTPTAATATACCPTPSTPTRSSATAGPMAACRS